MVSQISGNQIWRTWPLREESTGHWWYTHKGPVMRKAFLCLDVFMLILYPSSKVRDYFRLTIQQFWRFVIIMFLKFKSIADGRANHNSDIKSVEIISLYRSYFIAKYLLLYGYNDIIMLLSWCKITSNAMWSQTHTNDAWHILLSAFLPHT